MAATIVRLRPRSQRKQQAAAAEVAEQLSLLSPELLEDLGGDTRLVVSRAIHALQRAARPDEGLWPGGFTMLSRTQTAAIWDAIRALPADDRPNQVRHAFDLVLLNLRQDTGQVMLTRDELAERIGCTSNHVSRIMGVLERMGVIRRERQRVEGMRGRGVAAYFVNPHVAWNGSLDVRSKVASTQQPPLLTLMDGGKSPGSSGE